MSSFVEAGNAALSLLGEYNYITALSDSSPEAVTINANYERVLKQCLRNHFWNFALKRTKLAPSSTLPEWGSGKYFPLPSDFLRVYSINEDRYQEFTPESEGIYWEGGDVMNLKYIALVEDPNKFDSLFLEYYIASLAKAIAPAITDSREKMREMREMEAAALAQARSVDGDEDGDDRIWADTFLLARR